MNWTTDLAKCTSLGTCKRNFSQDHARAVTEQEDFIFIHIHLFRPARGNSPRIMPPQLLDRQRISSSSTYISSDLQEEILPGSCHHSYWTDRGSRLHPHTSLPTCKRNFSQVLCHHELLNRCAGSRLHPHTSLPTCKRKFSQDHATTVTEQTEDLVFIHIHLFRPARGNSPRIMPPQLLDRQRISSSSISQEWTLRQLSKFYESWLWIMFMDLVFIHIYLVDLQEELLTGLCQRSY